MRLGDLRNGFDVRAGLIGGALLGAIVWTINAPHGAWPASTAAIKQFAYTFLVGGLVIRFCTSMALRPGPAVRVLMLAVLLRSRCRRFPRKRAVGRARP